VDGVSEWNKWGNKMSYMVLQNNIRKNVTFSSSKTMAMRIKS